MRLLTTKIWRAFPELDPFDDEKCRHFVQVAGSAIVPRLVCTAIATLAGILGLISGCVMVVLISHWVTKTADQSSRAGHPSVWPVILAVVAVLLSTSLPPLVARDLFLRRRIRWVLSVRSACPKCGYSLLGLPVVKVDKVICPECGTEARVDPALVALSSNQT